MKLLATIVVDDVSEVREDSWSTLVVFKSARYDFSYDALKGKFAVGRSPAVIVASTSQSVHIAGTDVTFLLQIAEAVPFVRKPA